MDGESEGLRQQVARLELTIQAEMEKGKVLQVMSNLCSIGTVCPLCGTSGIAGISAGHVIQRMIVHLCYGI